MSGAITHIFCNIVVEPQALDTDAVSGTTVSSKCILKAVETAIEH
ncbi:MAG: FMN-binding protein [Roseburia sp.]|nr:FMN-binding protein [Roseburia sp.]